MANRRPPPNQEIHFLRTRLLRWFDSKGRTYPWRETPDPFAVLIAEIMLRRTKANQVIPVFQALLSRYPNPTSLARAGKSKVLGIVAPLGLAWRSPTFMLIARELVKRHRGTVPASRAELTRLTGVGDYVAGAVLSIAYGMREWIVDSNVVRLFSRYFALQTSKEARRDAHIIETAKRYVSRSRNPRKANLALLDFSALVCTPRNPRCETCTLRTTCHHVR